MSDTLRPYKDLFPEIGQRVMIDTSSVVIGDVRLADDVGVMIHQRYDKNRERTEENGI